MVIVLVVPTPGSRWHEMQSDRICLHIYCGQWNKFVFAIEMLFEFRYATQVMHCIYNLISFSSCVLWRCLSWISASTMTFTSCSRTHILCWLADISLSWSTYSIRPEHVCVCVCANAFWIVIYDNIAAAAAHSKTFRQIYYRISYFTCDA